MATKGIQNLHNALKEQGLQADITVDDMLYMIETDERFARAVHRSMAKNYNNIGDADSFYSKLGITYAKPKAVEETATINAEIQPTEAETPVVATPKVENPVAEIQPTAPVAEPKTPAQILAQTKEKTTSNNANSAPATDESMLAKEQEIMQAQAQAVAPQTAPQAEAQPVAQAENTQSVAEAQAEAQPMAQTSSIDRQFSTEADAPYDTTQAEQPTEEQEQAEQPQVAEETTEEQAQTEQPSARKVFLADGENIAQTEIVREDADNYYVLDDAGKEMPINKTYGNQFFDSYDQAKEFNDQFSLEAEGLAERILASANESKSANQAVNDIIINSSGYKQLQGNDFGEWAFGETQAYAADSDNASPMSVAVISEYIPLVAPVASTVKQLQGLAKHEDGGKVYQELFHAVKSVGETYALAKTDADYNKINQNLAKRVEGIRMTAYAEAVLDGENFAKAKDEIAKWTNADDPDKVDMPETNKALLIVDTMKRSLSWNAEHPELADYNPYKNWDRYINNPEAQNNVGYDIDNIEWALSNIEPTTLKQWLSQSGKHDESAWADASYKIFNARMGENAFGLQMNVGVYLNQEDAWMAGLLNNAGIKDIDHYIHNAWFDELYDAVKPQLLTVYKNEADAKQLVLNFVAGRQVSKVFNSEYDQDDYLNFLKEFGSNKGRYNMAMSKLDEPEEIERMFNEDQRSYDYAVSFYQAAKERNEKAKANLDQMQNGHDWLRLLGLAEPHMIAYRIGRNALDWLKGQDETSINEKVSDIITDYEENGKQKGLFGHVTYQSAGLWNYFNQQYNESANNYWVAKVETIEDTALPMVVDFAIGTKGLALLGKGAVKLAQTAKLANYYQQLKKGSRILRTASVLYAKNPAFRVAGKAFTHMGRASIAALAMPGTYMYDNSTKAVNINPETGEAQAVDVDPITFGEKYLEQAGAYLFFNELGAYSKGLVQGTMSASTKGLRKLLTHGSAERKALYQAGDLKTFAQEFKTAYGEAVKGIHKGGLQQTASLFGAYGAIPMVTHDLATSIIKGDEDMLKHMLTPDYYTDLAVTCLFMELGTFQLHGKAIKGIKTLAWNGGARADWSKIDATTRQRYEENLIDKSIEKQSEYISQEANRIRQIADENVRKQEAEVLSKAINYALVENARRGAEQIGVHTNMFSLSRLKAIDAIVEGTMTRYTANENAHIAELPVAKGWEKRTNEEVCVVTLADGQRAECVVTGREVITDGQYNQNVVRIEMQAKSKKASKKAKGKGKAKDADKILSIAVDPNSVEVPYVDGRKTFVIETTEKGAELKEAEVKSIDGENVTVIVDGKVHGIKRIDLYTDAYIALESAKALDAKIKADKAIVEMDSPKEIVAVTDADIKAEPQIATATEARVEAPEVEASHIRIEDKLAPGLVRDAHTETLAEADLVDKVAKKLGLSVRFVDAVDGGVANAKIEGNRVEIERNNPNPIKFLLGHELLHKIRTTSPDAYDAFVESARKAIPEFNKRLQMTRTAYQKADMKISNENAREEVFADFAGEMARDGKLLEKFIGESSPTLWQVLRDYYRKVKDLFTGKEFSDYERAEQALSNALKSASKLATEETMTEQERRYSIDTMFEAVGLRYEKAEDGATVIRDAKGNEVSEITPEMIHKSPLGASLENSVRNKIITEKQAEKQVEFFHQLYNMQLRVKDLDLIYAVSGALGFQPVKPGARDVADTDISGRKTPFASLTKNADPQYSTTIDFTTICLKTQAVIDVMSGVMMKLGRGLTEKEIVDIVYKNTHKAGEPVPCPVCYVFSRWVGLGGLFNNIKKLQVKYRDADNAKLAEDITTLSNRVERIKIQRGVGGTDAKKVLRKELTAMLEPLQYKLTVGGKLTAEEKREYDLLTEQIFQVDNLSWLRNVRTDPEYREVPDDVLFNINAGTRFAEEYPLTWKFRTTRGSAMGKAASPYAPLHFGQIMWKAAAGELAPILEPENNKFLKPTKAGKLDKTAASQISATRKRAKAQNLLNGQRLQSTSDFRFEFALDQLLAMVELQNIGAKAQLYTKVPESIDFFASCGAEVNCSLMPLKDGYRTRTDGTLELTYSKITGMNPADAFSAADRYDNVQPILVGINNSHMKLAMADPRILFIIPYHASGASESRYRSLMEAVEEAVSDKREDYTPYQGEKAMLDATPEMLAARELRLKILKGGVKELSEADKKVLESNDILRSLYERFYGKTIDGKEIAEKDPECYGVALKKDQAEHIFPFEYWDKTTTIETADVNGQRFVDYCHSLGYHPRFGGYTSKGIYKAEYDFTKESGYWKTLIDRRMYNRDGSYHEQKAVDVTNMDARYIDPKAPRPEINTPSTVNDPRKTASIVEQSIRDIESAELADTNTKYSLRTDPAPKKVEKVYKLMRLGEDGLLYPLYIDSTQGIRLKNWYDADSPNFEPLQKLEPGFYAYDLNNGKAEKLDAKPNAEQVRAITEQGKRPMVIRNMYESTIMDYEKDKANWESGKWRKKKPFEYLTEEQLNSKANKAQADAERRYGEPRRYYNLGINGRGEVGEYALRPGWHAGSLPTMRQIGKGAKKNLRDDSFVWVEGYVSADVNYQKEAEAHVDKDIPTKIPKDGFYLMATNADKAKSQADLMGWYIAGSFYPDRLISDREAREIIDKFNAEHPDLDNVEYDFVRESGLEFNPETMRLEAPTKYSLKREPNTETITDTATATAQSLGVKVAIINDATREFKGAFNPKTGEIEINTAFATSEADVQQTVVHEVIGHGGIQAIAGDKFAEWCQQAYDSMSPESRKQTSARHKGITEAKEIGAEYMADLAMGEVINPSLWQRMVGNIRLRLRQLGIDMNLTDADIRYMLYSAHQLAEKGKLQDSINHATTLAQLKEKAEQSHDVQEDFLSRPLMQVDPRLAPLSRGKYGMTDVQVMTTREYTDILRQTRLAEANDKSFGSKFSTTFIDSTLPIAEFVKSVYELESINDAYTYDAENNPHIGANTARSKAAYRVAKFGDNHRQGIARNMNEQYQALMKANSDWSYDYVEALRRLYCVAKTGLERNQKVQAREALKEKGKGHPRTDFAGITGAMKWLGIVMTDWKGKKLNSIDWELEAKLLGKRNADQLTTAQVKRILAQKGFPKIEDFVTWYESMVGDNTINVFWWRMSRASHEVLRNQLESGLLSTESYQRLRWGETFFDRLVREGLNPADIEGARYLTHPNELVDRGWITQEVADSFAPYYQYYLPLQGSVDIQQKNVINYDYRERRESKKAVHEIKGHKQMVLDPVYRFFENATKAIHNEEQNRWLRQLLNVVREHEATAKNDALAIATKTYVDANGKPFFRKDANGDYITDADGNYITTPTLAEIKSGQAIEVKRELDVFDNMKTQAELIDQHRVIVYEDGTPISMLFADKSIAQAVYDKPAVFRSEDPWKPLGIEVSWAAVGNGINKINRWQSMMFTSKNPMFMIPNIVRDAQGGLQYNLMQGGSQWQLYSAIIFNQKVRQDVWAEIKNRTNGYYSSKSQYGSYVQEFFENGGQTAFTEVASLDAIREDMRRTIKDFEDSAVLRRGETSSQAAMRIAKKGWRVYNEWIERQGMASELMARVATYIAARENNKSIERAIYEAKECSVNFDRKGKGNYRRWYGVFGTFLNAAFQACRREKTLWRTGGATKYLAYRIIKPIVARTLSAGMSYMYYAMDNETSDDEKSFYDWARMYFSQDTHVANANYLFPVLGNDRGSLSIPNAMDDIVWDKAVWLILKRACLGYNAEESVGDDIMEVLSQAVDMTGTNPVSRFVGTFTPAPAFKGEDFTLGDRVLYSAGANPTLAPFVEAYVNADYKGSRLYFEQRDQNDIKPDSSRDLNKYSWGHQIAVALNELSGGTDYDAGWIDLQGSTIQSIFSATGGVYDFVRRSIDMGKEIYHAANDVATTHYGEERVADLADILVAAPIVSRFAKQPISRYEQMAIMDHSRGIDDEVEQWSKKVADAFKEGDSNRAANILNDVVESYRSADYMLALGRQNATSTYYSARSAEIKAYIDNLANQSYYNTELDVSAQANIIIGRALLWAKCVGNGASGSALENIKADDSAGLLYSIYKYAIPERRKIIKALSTADDANKEQYLNALAKLEQTIVDKFNAVDEVEYLPERKTEEDYNQ